MAYNELLADRIRRAFRDQNARFEEKKMMGGLCFLVNDKMCAGVVGDKLMARIGPEGFEEALLRPGARQMDFTGRPLKGYAFVEPEGIDTDMELEWWLQGCLAFNPKAKSSKKG